MSTRLPIHDYFQTPGTSGVHISFVNFDLDQEDHGFGGTDNMQPAGNNSTHTNFTQSTYQSFVPLTSREILITEEQCLADECFFYALLSFDEGQPLGDEVLPYQVVSISENQDLDDSVNWAPTILIEEGIAADDSISLQATLSLDEPQPLFDHVFSSSYVPTEEGQPLGDDLSASVTVLMDEEQPLGDGITAFIGIPIDERQPLGDDLYCRLDYNSEFSMKVEILKESFTDQSMQIQIPIFTPKPVESITHIDNVFEPILVIDGVIYAGTPPPGTYNLNKIRRSAGMGCDVISWSLSLNFQGGSFEVRTIGGRYMTDSVTICGLRGTATEWGTITGPNGYEGVTRGIFGDRNMNRQLLLLAQNVPGVYPMGVPMQAAPRNSWSTISACARAVALIGGINFSWMAEDGVLTDVFPQSGMTIGSALQSLASMVGGTLCLNGDKSYTVINLDQPLGGCNPFPHCSLISNIDAVTCLEIDERYCVMPVNQLVTSGWFMGDKTNSALYPAKPEIVVPLWGSRSAIQSGQPDSVIDLPPDFKLTSPGNPFAANGRIQIVVEPDQIGDPYTTTDDSKWFPAGLPVKQDPDTGIFKMTLSQLPFPPSLSDGEFSMRVGYVRGTQGLEEAARAAWEDGVQRQQTMITIQQGRLHYLKTGAANCAGFFTGAIPLPGRSVGFEKGSTSFEGICESTNITCSLDSLVTMNVAAGKYRRSEILTASQYLDAYWASGGHMGP